MEKVKHCEYFLDALSHQHTTFAISWSLVDSMVELVFQAYMLFDLVIESSLRRLLYRCHQCVYVCSHYSHKHNISAKILSAVIHPGQRLEFLLPPVQQIRPLTEASAAVNHYCVIADSKRACTVHLGPRLLDPDFPGGISCPTLCLSYSLQLLSGVPSRDGTGLFQRIWGRWRQGYLNDSMNCIAAHVGCAVLLSLGALAEFLKILFFDLGVKCLFCLSSHFVVVQNIGGDFVNYVRDSNHIL